MASGPKGDGSERGASREDAVAILAEAVLTLLTANRDPIPGAARRWPSEVSGV